MKAYKVSYTWFDGVEAEAFYFLNANSAEIGKQTLLEKRNDDPEGVIMEEIEIVEE